ncbi:mechanosensitive ion channel family protein, partial [Pseudomonas syringae pv. actinidiae]|nr:mechanosensitive ion channel family protein [Pseudomonas syringae pv. actinidiae]
RAFQVGQQVQVGDTEGQIEEIGTVKTTLLNRRRGAGVVSNRILLEQRVISR